MGHIHICFNPCFNGSMYKNKWWKRALCGRWNVSILVLMELCIKTIYTEEPDIYFDSFNPCFNGTMYKNNLSGNPIKRVKSFNPCFNGTMYKNRK